MDASLADSGIHGEKYEQNLALSVPYHGCQSLASMVALGAFRPQLTATSMAPIFSISQCMTSPGTTRDTPSQVPVMMMSPG
jgi:hypothetical protein